MAFARIQSVIATSLKNGLRFTVTCLGMPALVLTEPFALLCLAVAFVDTSGRLTAEHNQPG